jgi:hypothetical protein
MWKRLCVLATACVLLALIASGAAVTASISDSFLDRQIVVVNDSCTGTVIDQWRVLTASHCVGLEGDEATIRSGPAQYPARVTWDSVAHPRNGDRARRGLDAAVLTLLRPWPYFERRVCFEARPVRGPYISRSFSLRQEWWTVRPVLRVVATDMDLGEVAVWASDQLPGSSGSLVFSEHAGCGVAMVTHIVITRGLVMGAVGWRLWEVVRHGEQ